MDGLLFLAHRIPYPPNKGDKVRSFHILRHLASRYRVHLVSFVDDPGDWEHAGHVRAMCESCLLVPLRPRVARIGSLRALLDGRPLSLAYFRDRRIRTRVRRILNEPSVRRAFVFSSPMAQYLLDQPPPGSMRRVLDLVDVDSDKWAQYSRKARWPLSWMYAREGRTLLEFERSAAMEFDASVLVSEAEAGLFRKLAPECSDRVTFMENGVDADFFSPEREYPDPYDGHGSVLVFTGAMDYRANVDAVCWFTNEVFPQVRQRHPRARFFIVGARPAAAVQKLAREEGVTVTGRVEDVRPYLAHARVSVAPLRIARGIQNKVLEAAAMGRPVLASPAAMDGLHFDAPRFAVVETVEEWLEAVGRALTEDLEETGRRMRDQVVESYAWPAKLSRLVELLDRDRENGVPGVAGRD